MKTRIFMVAMLVAAFGLGSVGCKKETKEAPPKAAEGTEAEEPSAQAEPTGEATSPAVTERPVAPRAERPQAPVLTVEQHMERVKTEISSDNYKQELDKLGAQLEQRELHESSRDRAANPDAPAPQVRNEPPAPEGDSPAP